MPHIAKVEWWKTVTLITKVARQTMSPRILVAVRLKTIYRATTTATITTLAMALPSTLATALATTLATTIALAVCRNVFNLQKLPLGSANMVAKKKKENKKKRKGKNDKTPTKSNTLLTQFSAFDVSRQERPI